MCFSPVLIAIVALGTAADEPWTPPENPDPSAILREAQADTRARKYEEALAKHVWYHRNALKHQPSQAGVRLSFALMYWKQLADVHPPALFKLIEMREDAVLSVMDGKDARQSFQELAAISKTLGEEFRTKDVFVTLHSQKPEVAKQVFSLARPALIKGVEYKLCGNYLDPERDFRLIATVYDSGKRLAKDPKFGDRHLDFVNKSFTNQTTTLVALLVINYRKPEAEKIANDAKEEWQDATFHKAIDDALKGNVPDPWP